MHERIQRGGGRGSGPPLENHKNIGFFSNTGPVPFKILKLPSQLSILAIIGTQAKCHLNGVSLADRRGSAYSGIWIILPPSYKKTLSRLDLL